MDRSTDYLSLPRIFKAIQNINLAITKYLPTDNTFSYKPTNLQNRDSTPTSSALRD